MSERNCNLPSEPQRCNYRLSSLCNYVVFASQEQRDDYDGALQQYQLALESLIELSKGEMYCNEALLYCRINAGSKRTRRLMFMSMLWSDSSERSDLVAMTCFTEVLLPRTPPLAATSITLLTAALACNLLV